MAKQVIREPQPDTPPPALGSKTVGICPHCGASRFLAGKQYGEIINGEFVSRRNLLECVNCHAQLETEQLEHRETVAAG